MLLDMMQVRSNALITFVQSDRPHRGKIEHLQKTQTYSGNLSPGGRKRLLNSLDLMIQRSPPKRILNTESGKFFDFRLNFVTLTLTNSGRVITASEAYQTLLAPWLRYMKQKQGLSDYLWKAELQQNGQIHYHIATNTFLPMRIVRWRWNNLARKERLLDNFAKQYGHFNPPSTEVTSITHVQDAKSYIAKEFAKKQQNQASVKGKVWDCNVELKKPLFTDVYDSRTWLRIQDAIAQKQVIEKKLENCVLYLTNTPLLYLNQSTLINYKNYIK